MQDCGGRIYLAAHSDKRPTELAAMLPTQSQFLGKLSRRWKVKGVTPDGPTGHRPTGKSLHVVPRRIVDASFVRTEL
jgi:hypothetical protein